jgi:hypothetical protein
MPPAVRGNVFGPITGQEVETLTKEIDRLRSLIRTAIVALRREGADDAARRVERGLAGG